MLLLFSHIPLFLSSLLRASLSHFSPCYIHISISFLFPWLQPQTQFTFQVFDFIGRSLPRFFILFSPRTLWIPTVLRFGFFPLFILCLGTHSGTIPLVFDSDGWYYPFMAIFALTNGYCGSMYPSLSVFFVSLSLSLSFSLSLSLFFSFSSFLFLSSKLALAMMFGPVNALEHEKEVAGIVMVCNTLSLIKYSRSPSISPPTVLLPQLWHLLSYPLCFALELSRNRYYPLVDMLEQKAKSKK